ncbi:MAG: cyclic pyranopterin monophosphate synthase MoaC [Blastochloris sp.]|nr:cyclic pyranopterin monophosphate synthase MoaC [Blastochloris sp.]
MKNKSQHFSHLDKQGKASMVDVSSKPDQVRRATATGRLVCQAATIRLLRQKALKKGDALTVAQIAGIQAAKQCATLIPLCHPLPLDHVRVEFTVKAGHIAITATTATTGKTGVEMEALTAVSAAALTLYDMMKAVDKTMRIEAVKVASKTKETTHQH